MADYSHLTIMYALPRSMTQWWRWFFGHGCHAVHDPLARMRHPDKLKALVDAAEGEQMFVADTSAILFHRRFQRILPGHRRLYMTRNVDDVIRSIREQGMTAPVSQLIDMHARLLRHAYAEDRNIRIHYGCVRELDLLYRQVTGVTTGRPDRPLDTRIDTPLRKQYRNAADIKSLLAYQDMT